MESVCAVCEMGFWPTGNLRTWDAWHVKQRQTLGTNNARPSGLVEASRHETRFPGTRGEDFHGACLAVFGAYVSRFGHESARAWLESGGAAVATQHVLVSLLRRLPSIRRVALAYAQPERGDWRFANPLLLPPIEVLDVVEPSQHTEDIYLIYLESIIFEAINKHCAYFYRRFGTSTSPKILNLHVVKQNSIKIKTGRFACLPLSLIHRIASHLDPTSVARLRNVHPWFTSRLNIGARGINWKQRRGLGGFTNLPVEIICLILKCLDSTSLEVLEYVHPWFYHYLIFEEGSSVWRSLCEKEGWVEYDSAEFKTFSGQRIPASCHWKTLYKSFKDDPNVRNFMRIKENSYKILREFSKKFPEFQEEIASTWTLNPTDFWAEDRLAILKDAETHHDAMLAELFVKDALQMSKSLLLNACISTAIRNNWFDVVRLLVSSGWLEKYKGPDLYATACVAGYDMLNLVLNSTANGSLAMALFSAIETHNAEAHKTIISMKSRLQKEPLSDVISAMKRACQYGNANVLQELNALFPGVIHETMTSDGTSLLSYAKLYVGNEEIIAQLQTWGLKN